MEWGEKIALVWKRLAFDLLATRVRFQCGFAGPLLVVDDVALLGQLGGRSGWAAFETLGADYLIHESSLEPDAWRSRRKLLLIANTTRLRRVALRLIRRAVRHKVRGGAWQIEVDRAESRWVRVTLMGLLWILGALATHALALIAIRQWSVFRGHSIATALAATGVVLLMVICVHLFFAMGRWQLRGRFVQHLIANQRGLIFADDLGHDHEVAWTEVASIDARYRCELRLRAGQSFVLPPSMRLRAALAEVCLLHGVETARHARLSRVGAAAWLLGLSLVPATLVYLVLTYLPGGSTSGLHPGMSSFMFGLFGLVLAAALVWDRKRNDKMR